MKPIKRVTGLKDRLYGFQCPECMEYIHNHNEKPKACKCGTELDWD